MIFLGQEIVTLCSWTVPSTVLSYKNSLAARWTVLGYIIMVYCSKELYDVNTSKMVHEFDLPPLCIQLYHNHFTALMYKSESSLQLMPVLHGQRYRRI